MVDWIKCDDRLPEKSEDDPWMSITVLITDGKYIGIGYYEFEYHIEDDPNATEEQTLTFSDAVWHSDVDYLDRDYCGWPEITHWAEMPKLPSD